MDGREKSRHDPLQNALTQSASPLFRLPAELRNRIYELALHGDTHSMPAKRRKTGVGSKLLATCKTVYAEALQIYYNQCEFHFHSFNTLRIWLDGLSRACRKCLRRIRYSEVVSSAFEFYDNLKRDQWSRAEFMLSKIEHILQAKDVALGVGAVKVHVGYGCYAWGFDQQGRKTVMEQGVSDGRGYI